MSMYQPIIIWAIIVCILILAIIVRAINTVSKKTKPKRPFIEMGTERELLYCPGDKKTSSDDDIENL